jgi:hypothetical protein
MFTYCRHKTYVQKYLFYTPYTAKYCVSCRFVVCHINKYFKSQLQSVTTDVCYTRISAYFSVHRAVLRSTNQFNSDLEKSRGGPFTVHLSAGHNKTMRPGPPVFWVYQSSWQALCTAPWIRDRTVGNLNLHKKKHEKHSRASLPKAGAGPIHRIRYKASIRAAIVVSCQLTWMRQN